MCAPRQSSRDMSHGSSIIAGTRGPDSWSSGFNITGKGRDEPNPSWQVASDNLIAKGHDICVWHAEKCISNFVSVWIKSMRTKNRQLD